MVMAGDRDPPLLHRLKQCRLGTRTGSVDLVRHQELTEHGPADKPKRTAPRFGFFKNLRTEDVCRHQVGGKLHPPLFKTKDEAQRFHKLGLAEAGNPNEKEMAAGEYRDQGLGDDLMLPEDGAGDRVPRPCNAVAQLI